MQEPLAHRLADDASAEQIAGTVLVIWEGTFDALSPLIGVQGVRALYSRTVHRVAAQYPWLAGGDVGVVTDSDPSVLKSVLAHRNSAEAAAGCNAFLQTFHDLLASLIGASLTDRLLRSAWESASSGTTLQDTSP